MIPWLFLSLACTPVSTPSTKHDYLQDEANVFRECPALWSSYPAFFEQALPVKLARLHELTEKIVDEDALLDECSLFEYILLDRQIAANEESEDVKRRLINVSESPQIRRQRLDLLLNLFRENIKEHIELRRSYAELDALLQRQREQNLIQIKKSKEIEKKLFLLNKLERNIDKKESALSKPYTEVVSDEKP